MAKKGGSNHYVRMRANKDLGVIGRKSIRWLLAPAPGTHKKEESISTGVLLRDVLGKSENTRETKRIIHTHNLLIDGKKVSDTKYPVGLMDVLELPSEKKHFRMSLSGPKLTPVPISAEAAGKKYLKVTRKHTVTGKKVCITFHDGRNYLGDEHIKTGDTCVLSVPGFKLLSHIKLQPGAQCLVMKGKHIGESAKLERIIERLGSHDTEVLMSGAQGEFITVAKYLFAIDGNF
ncbi:MAG: hypothetical protein NT051_03835 [Candidatus Micrarchaeota archaeon]|nr:hypothetical protein [Candidatus Micrarchaeota archaeon]